MDIKMLSARVRNGRLTHSPILPPNTTIATNVAKKAKPSLLPKTFKDLCILFDETMHFTNVLCVNTTRTGLFLDKMYKNKKDNANKTITRIKYTPTSHETLATKLQELNTRFDLICLDPYHEPKYTISDLSLLVSYLTDDGVLVCHDCNPPDTSYVRAYYAPGINWCGVTYAEFVEFAYKNPELFYAVIDNDYGLGIVSKTQNQFATQITDNQYQQTFLHFFEQDHVQAFKYFKTHSKELINLIRK